MTVPFTTNLRRLACGALLAAALGAVAAPGAAQARPGPDPDPSYLVTANVDGRYYADRGEEIWDENFLKKGQRVDIECQKYGDRMYGSRLWDLVEHGVQRYYVPDAFIKTGTDGRHPDIRECGRFDWAKSGYETDPFD